MITSNAHLSFPSQGIARISIICLLSVGFIPAMAQKKLLALSKADHVLAIIDPATGKTLARVPVGNDPHEVIASSDGRTAYVSITGGGTSREIDVIDLVAMKRLPDIDTRPLQGPHGLDFADGKLWFSAEGSRSVGRYDPAIKSLDWAMGTGEDRTHMVFVTPDAKHVYTTNVNAGTVSLLQDTLMTPNFGPPPGPPQPRHVWLNTVVPVSKGAEGFDVSPDGRELWTAAAADGEVWIIDLATKKNVGKASVVTKGANRLKFSTDGKLVLVSSLSGGDLFIIDAAKRTLVKTRKLGKGCAGILTDPDSKKAYVACTPDNLIQIVDLDKLEIVGKIELAGPDGLAWAK
jgi:DNA-binding beta-propeller fold protein YncE